ncbi:MAG: N-6 DNA methylase [Prevotella sp.]|jgi:type I restriction enzyme M protein
MININNFKDVLLSMGFHKETMGNYYTKDFGTFKMSADFDNKVLYYPDKVIVNDKTTSNFSHDENFVVFECVNRLMEKGYLPETIELEPKWRLGHESKVSGKPDILIKDLDGNDIIIIECKTAGKEYRKEKKNTETDGGQLFSYWQQSTGVKWLALYASDWVDGQISVESDVINGTDDANILKMSEKDKDVKVFTKAKDDKERFEVWRDTYNCQWLGNLIFSDDNQAYNIELKPLRKQDLKDFNPDDKIVNQFEEILRHNNVSDKENAFNRLVALFICKLVDEIKKQDYEEVDFQYKYTDTYETLQDRLQHLHQQGMEEFMKEKIFYVDDGYADRLFEQYTGQKRKAAIADLKKTIRILKFYSNNDFAFKDVHNEELFYQNGKILVEVVQLFQPYRIVYPSKHQFLGDLFEQLLNKGFKQNEGQFFTPTPITRFIWDSLPISNYISEHDLPRVLDYACGAGHFLTEAIEAINAIHPNEDNSWVEKHIYGVEKDYRLARVSKVSMFMNGAGSSNIVFGDGLENYPEKGIEPESFDILVANPPYSVDGFKRHLSLHNNTFSILDKITFNGSEIEALFVERIAQVLKPQGIAAVILPASILSNGSASYTAAREQILQNFKLHAIVAFGSKTFGATGTNTVTLFLEKYNEPPKQAEVMKDFVQAVVDESVNKDWHDKEILQAYLAHQNIDEYAYRRFFKKHLDWEDLKSDSYFKVYYDAFKSHPLAIPKNITTAEEEEKFKFDKFYSNAIAVEKEKLYYFALAYGQHTLVVTSPEDNKEQKVFLGYDWSNRKGDEGIKISHRGGMLYDDENRSAHGTIAHAIRNSFEGANTTEIRENREKYVKWYWLIDMLDFGNPIFNKVITLNIEEYNKPRFNCLSINFSSLVRPMQDANKKISKKNILPYGKYPVVTQEDDKLIAGYTNEDSPITSLPVIVFGDHSCNFKYVDFPFYRGADGTQVFKVDEERAILKYVYYYLSSVKIPYSDRYERHYKYLKKLEIPLPNKSIQQQIVSECEQEDNTYNKCIYEINEIEKKCEDLIRQSLKKSNFSIRLSDPEIVNITIGRRVLKQDVLIEGEYDVYSANVYEPFGKTNTSVLSSFSIPSIIWGIDGDWMVNYIEANHKFNPTDHCGVIRVVDESKVLPRYLAYVLRDVGNKMRFNRTNRPSTQRIKSLTISVPPINVQNETINSIILYDNNIKELKKLMSKCIQNKQAILDKYLN